MSLETVILDDNNMPSEWDEPVIVSQYTTPFERNHG